MKIKSISGDKFSILSAFLLKGVWKVGQKVNFVFNFMLKVRVGLHPLAAAIKCQSSIQFSLKKAESILI